MADDTDEATPLVIMIAMPTRGEVALETVKSLIGLTQEFQRHGLAFSFDTYDTADQVINRNHLMSKFLTNAAYSHMLMLDSDMEFSPDAVWRLIALGADFACTAYPQKYYNWADLRRLIEAESALPEAERTPTEILVSRSMTYNHQLRDFGNKDWTPEQHNGFVSIPAAGHGLALVSRKVPETMVAKGIVKKYPDMALIPGHRGLDWYNFFGHLAPPDGRQFLHNDQSFSMRWVNGCGGTIWLDCETTVRHAGTHVFEGCYADRVKDDFPSL